MGLGAKPPWELKKTAGNVTKADVAAVTARFPVTAPDIGPGAVTTVAIANDAVTQPKAATGVVDGDTITGAVFQTSVPGVGHPTIMLDGPNNLAKFYSGLTGESPSTLDPSATSGGTLPAVTIASGTTATIPSPASLLLQSGAAGGGLARLGVSTLTVDINGTFSPKRVEISGGNLKVNGDTEITGVGTGAGMDSFQVACNSQAAVTTTGNTTISGLSQAVTSPGTSAVYIVTLDVDWSITVTGTIALIELLVDGIAQTAQMRLNSNGGTGVWCSSKRWRITGLTAGSHTFTSQTRNTANSTGSVVAATNTLMTVERKA